MPASGIFSIKDLREIDEPANSWFSSDTKEALAGRCLLDVLEYVRADPKFPGRFRQVTNAHAIRLLSVCFGNDHLKRTDALARIKGRLAEMCKTLLAKRNNKPPYYGDDFWDWASVIDCFVEAKGRVAKSGISKQRLTQELSDFCDAVKDHLEEGLAFKVEGEWYGPATAAIAYRLLKSQRALISAGKREMDDVLARLRAQALEPVTKGKYRGVRILPHHILWHCGQVVAEFGLPAADDAASHLTSLAALDSIEGDQRVYALARILQAAKKTGDVEMQADAMARLYKSENQARPLGHGLLGDNVKGALNAIEAIWRDLDASDYDKIAAMIDALVTAQARANTIGIVVAIEHEMEAVRVAFGAKAKPAWVKDINTLEIENATFKVVACGGKGILGSARATEVLIRDHNAKAIIMIGIAGSLGKFDPKDPPDKKKPRKKRKFLGPDKGHVVISTSAAPYEIRKKVREIEESVGVPFAGEEWEIIPTDPLLFRAAHTVVGQMEQNQRKYFEGLIVSGNGIRDSIAGKDAILAKFPGGLAVEEEGYLMAIICMMSGVPCINIRGISDRAEGDKVKQGRDPVVEKREQSDAASAAAGLAVKLVEKITSEW